MAEIGVSFAEMLQALAQSKSPLSVRLDQDFRSSPEELEMARRTVGHVMADADLRSRLSTLRVEPLVRAAALLLEDCRRAGAATRDRASASLVLEYLTLLDKAFGNVPSILNNRGVARSLLGDTAAADADFASARRLAPSFIAPRVNEIEVVRRAGDFARLERIAEEIERTDPGNVAALRAAVDAKIALRRPPADVAQAAGRLHESKAARPNDLLLLGNLSLAASDAAGAESYLRELVEVEPRHVEGHVRLAAVLLDEAKFPEAVGIYEKLTEIDGPKPDYWLAMASTYERMGRLDDALSVYTSALQHVAPRDRDGVSQALREFQERHGARPPDGGASPPANLERAQSPAEPPAPIHKDGVPPAPALELAPSRESEPEPSLDEAAEPRVIGDTDFEVGGAAHPVGEGSPRPPDTESPEAPPADPKIEPPLSQAERLGAALEANAAGYEDLDDLLGDAPPGGTAPVPPQHEHEDDSPTAAPGTPAPPDGTDPLALAPATSESITPLRTPSPDDEAILAAMPVPESLVVARGPGGAGTSAPVVNRSPRPAPASPAPTPPRQPAEAGPLVSSPPPPREEPDESVTAELAALERTTQAAGPGSDASAEPFRRPAFDVDAFMAALEAKTKPVFDHLYDGMLEARRKETAGPPPKEPVSAWYESSPPSDAGAGSPALEGPPVATVSGSVAAPGGPAPEEPAPAIPLLLQAAAKQVQRGATRAAQDNDPALAEQAYALAQAGDATAETVLDRYLAGGPPDARAWNLKGDLRERAVDEAGALEAYWKAVKYDPAHKEAWNNLGVLLHLLGRYEEASQVLESGTKVDPRDRHLWHNLGSTYHELGRLDDALSAFSHAIEIAPDDKVSYNNQGTTLFEKGDFKAARAAFERAAALDPRFEQAHNNLGRTLEKLEDLEGAARSYQTAVALNERSLPALRNLARVLERLGRSKEASALGSRLEALGA